MTVTTTPMLPDAVDHAPGATPGTARGVTPRPATRGRQYWSRSWVLVVSVAAFLTGVVIDIEVPGVYMDAVNPDYLVVLILHRDRSFPVWVLPGNYIAGRYSVLTQLYHGTQHVWLGLPFFALLGTSVVSLRIVHGLFGCAILAAALGWMRRGGLVGVALASVGVALAVDPSFVFAFRTQTSIVLAPVAWLLLSLVALDRAGEGRQESMLALSGAAYGLAVFGYFTYVFFLPVVLAALLFWPFAAAGLPVRPWPRAWRRLPLWTVGVGVGAVLYLLGYALLAGHQGGVARLVEYLGQAQAALGVWKPSLSLWNRIEFAWRMVESITRNSWHSNLMVGTSLSVPAADLKTLFLTVGPVALWLIAEGMGSADRYLRTSIAMGLSFFAVSLAFGNRLVGHHYAVLLVLGYACLAFGIHALARHRAPCDRLLPSTMVVLPMLVLTLLNLAGQLEIRSRLRDTGGVGLYSDAINRLAVDAQTVFARNYYFLPDWGFLAPFVFLTSGRSTTSWVPSMRRPSISFVRDDMSRSYCGRVIGLSALSTGLASSIGTSHS